MNSCQQLTISSVVILLGLSNALTAPPPASPSPQTDNQTATARDWTTWGGHYHRNNVSPGKGIPTRWRIGELEWSNTRTPLVPANSEHIKWVARLGSASHGTPAVASGRIFIGTNNGAGYLAHWPSDIDLGVLLCLDEQTGEFLWQHSNQKLETGRVEDWPLQGVCSTPVVAGDRLYYVSNRCEVVCLDTEGFYDGEDDHVGPTAESNWTHVFRESLTIEADRGLLKEEFARVGIKLPRYLRTQRDGPFGWTILMPRSEEDRHSGLIPTYAIRFDGGQLRAYRVSSSNLEPPGDLLFSVANNRFPGLAADRIDASLQDALRRHSVTLPRGTLLYKDEHGWSFTGLFSGERRQFRLQRQQDHLLATRRLETSDVQEADVVWRLDMRDQLGVKPHNMSNCSIALEGGKLFVCTSNGVDETHIHLPAPEAPSFIALDAVTGDLLWQDNSPGSNVLHGQWGSPSYGVFGGQPQVIFPGGDGWLYSFDPAGDGRGGSKLLWKFDANPKTSRWILGGRGERNNLVTFPVIADGLIYVAVGQDPEHGEGPGRLWCVDPTKRLDGGDISAELAVDAAGQRIPHKRLRAVEPNQGEQAIPNPDSGVLWVYTGSEPSNTDPPFPPLQRSLASPVIQDDILYITDRAGFVHCLHAKTGQRHWRYDLYAACWSTPLLVDGHVYVTDEDGDIHVFRHSSDPEVAFQLERSARENHIETMNLLDSVYSTPVVANNVLYIATRRRLFAIERSATDPKPKQNAAP